MTWNLSLLECTWDVCTVRASVKRPPQAENQHQDPEILHVKIVDSVSFIALAINGTAQVESKSRKIYIIVNVAELFLGLKYLYIIIIILSYF